MSQLHQENHLVDTVKTNDVICTNDENIQHPSTKSKANDKVSEGATIDVERVNKVDLEEHLRLTTQSKIKITLTETDKVKELEMISGDTKDVDNINYKNEDIPKDNNISKRIEEKRRE